MKLRPFELGLVIVFVGLALGSLILLSVWKPKNETEGAQIGTVAIWGTLPAEAMNGLLDEILASDETYQGVSYRYIAPEEFDSELVNALADGTGPDVALIPHEKIVSMRKRIQPISYDAYPRRDFQTTFADGAQIFLLSDGIYGYPIVIDPLVLYWNKNILTTDGFLEAPKTWEALVNDYLPTLIRRNPDRSITRSVVAMGEYNNVRNSLGIISLLLMQAGSKGVVELENNVYEIRLDQSADEQTKPLRVSADFYTRFSKPNNSLYSWNRSFTEDRERFLSEDLALYFGYGSEGKEIEKLNPNLTFDSAEVPQGAEATVRRTYAHFYALSALRTSENLSGAMTVISKLGSKEISEKIAAAYNMVPATRASISGGSNDTYGRINYKSAGIAFGWLTPSESATDEIFSTMTSDINENRYDLSTVINDTIGRLQIEYN